MIKYLKYKGEELPIRLSYFAIKKLKEAGKDLSDLMKGELDTYEDILLYSLQSGYKAEGKECPWKMEDMEDILDECMWDFTATLPAFFPHLNNNKTAPDQVQTTEFKEQVKKIRKK